MDVKNEPPIITPADQSNVIRGTPTKPSNNLSEPRYSTARKKGYSLYTGKTEKM